MDDLQQGHNVTLQTSVRQWKWSFKHKTNRWPRQRLHREDAHAEAVVCERTEDTDVMPEELLRIVAELPAVSFSRGLLPSQKSVSMPRSWNTDGPQGRKALCGWMRCRVRSSVGESFTSFCKNDGTDLLIFFKWSGSEKEEEEGVEMAETVEQYFRESLVYLRCLRFKCLCVFTFTAAPEVSSRVSPPFLSFENSEKQTHLNCHYQM